MRVVGVGGGLGWQRWLCPKAINILDTLFRNSDRPSARDVEEVHISWRVLTKKAECVPTTYRVFCHIARTSSLYAGIITGVEGGGVGGGDGGRWRGMGAQGKQGVPSHDNLFRFAC